MGIDSMFQISLSFFFILRMQTNHGERLLESDQNQTVIVYFGLICIASSFVVLAWIMAPFIRTVYETTIGRPQLIRETTRPTFPYSILSYVAKVISHCLFWRKEESTNSTDAALDEIILPQHLKERVLDFAYCSRESIRQKVPLQNALFYGPAGTGKKMLAKKLASFIGIDYAVISGEDVDSGAASEGPIHNLLSWARTSPRGVLLFIEKADAFFLAADSGLICDSSRVALDAFLHHAGGLHRNIVLIISTNRAEDLDESMSELCQESIYIPLPDLASRRELVLLYYNIHVKNYVEQNNQRASSLRSQLIQLLTKRKPPIMTLAPNIMAGEHFDELCTATRGFSAEEISQLMVTLQHNIHLTANVLEFDVAWDLISKKVVEHQNKLTKAGEHTLTHSENDIEFM